MTTTTIKSSTIISPSIPQTFRSRPKLMPPGGWKLPHLDTLLDDVDVSSPDRRRLRPSTAHFSCLPPHGGPVNGFVFGPSRSACFFFLLRLLIEPDILSFPSRFTGLIIEFI
ncbi:hypothetical protein NW765_009656 [Fusarium oxysporum]|nr:hypothetical protein NW765_009656 [Fusarium oxysporum]